MVERPITEIAEISKKIDRTIEASMKVLNSFGMTMPGVSFETKEQLKQDAREFYRRTHAVVREFIDHDFPLEIVAETTEPAGIVVLPAEGEAEGYIIHLSRTQFREKFENTEGNPENNHIGAISLFMGIARLTLEEAASEVKLPWDQKLTQNLIDDLKQEIISSSAPYDNFQEIINFSTSFLDEAMLRPDLRLIGRGATIHAKSGDYRYGDGNTDVDGKLKLQLAAFMAQTFIKEMKKLPWFNPSESWVRITFKDFREKAKIPAERDSYLENLLNSYLSGDLARKTYQELLEKLKAEQEKMTSDQSQSAVTLVSGDEHKSEVDDTKEDTQLPEVMTINSQDPQPAVVSEINVMQRPRKKSKKNNRLYPKQKRKLEWEEQQKPLRSDVNVLLETMKNMRVSQNEIVRMSGRRMDSYSNGSE